MPRVNKFGFNSLLLLFSISYAFAYEFPKIPNKLEDKVAISITKADTGDQIFAYNATKPMLLASNMKIVTSYVALNQLGNKFYWPTKLSYQGEIQDNTLNGNIYLIGGGDPSLTHNDVAEIFKHLDAINIHKINGNIILDSSIFNTMVTTSETKPEPFAEYSVDPNGLLIDTNLSLVNLKIRNGKITLSKSKIKQYLLKNKLTVLKSKALCDDTNDYVTIIKTQAKTLELQGQIPPSCNNRPVGINLFSNYEFDKDVVKQILRKEHIILNGSIESGTAPDDSQLVYSHNSESILPIMVQMNKFSNNTTAKTLYLSLGAYKTENIDTNQDSKKLYLATLAKDFSFNELTPENGSGLSRTEKLSASHMTELLYKVYQSPYYSFFRNSLPTPAEPGTLRNDFKQYNQMLYVKTGTLSDVKAYSGYFTTDNGDTYILSFIINDMNNQTETPDIIQFKKLFASFLSELNNS